MGRKVMIMIVTERILQIDRNILSTDLIIITHNENKNKIAFTTGELDLYNIYRIQNKRVFLIDQSPQYY